MHTLPVDQAWLRQQNVAIATPSGDGQVHLDYLHALLDTYQTLNGWGVHLTLLTVPGQTVEMARNALVQSFLEGPELTHMLWIDTDQAWKPEDVVRLLVSQKDVIGAPIRKKCQGSEWNVQLLDEWPLKLDPGGFFEVRGIGTGFLCVRRRVYETMQKAYPELRVRVLEPSEPYYALFQHTIAEDGFWRSEDLTFCARWRALGGQVWADPNAAIHHFGEKDYIGRFVDCFDFERTAAGAGLVLTGGAVSDSLRQSA